MRNAGLEEAQAGIKIARRNINNLRYADDTTLMAESEEELNSLLMKVKVESEKVGLKLNFFTLGKAGGPASGRHLSHRTRGPAWFCEVYPSESGWGQSRAALTSRRWQVMLDWFLGPSSSLFLPLMTVPLGRPEFRV